MRDRNASVASHENRIPANCCKGAWDVLNEAESIWRAGRIEDVARRLSRQDPADGSCVALECSDDSFASLCRVVESFGSPFLPFRFLLLMVLPAGIFVLLYRDLSIPQIFRAGRLRNFCFLPVSSSIHAGQGGVSGATVSNWGVG